MEDLNQLKIVLVKKKRTSKWLAEQLGVNQTTVSKWCTNTTQPDLQTLKRITELLEVNSREIKHSAMNEITISSMLPAVRNTALMRGKTYIGIDFGTSTTVVSIVSYDEYDHKIHTKSLRLPQMLPDGTLYRSEIVPTVIAWLNGRILVGEGASQMKYQLKKGKNI